MSAKKLNQRAGREKEAPVARKNKSSIAKASRSRPGRRTNEERKAAVLELLGGKASVDLIAQRYGVLPETVEGWRSLTHTLSQFLPRRFSKTQPYFSYAYQPDLDVGAPGVSYRGFIREVLAPAEHCRAASRRCRFRIDFE